MDIPQESIGVLYNTLVDGTFSFSLLCQEEYKQRTGKEIDYIVRQTLPFVPTPTTEYNVRVDPVLIDLYVKKGSEWISGSCSTLSMAIVPRYMTEYIVIMKSKI